MGDLLHLSGPGQVELLRAFAEKGASLRTTVHGSSMFPFVRDGDVVTLSPPGERGVRVGDVVAFRHPAHGGLVIHRVVDRDGEGWLVRGDCCARADGVVAGSEVLARVTRVERLGKEVRLGVGAGDGVVAALSRGGWTGTGPGLATVPARGVRRILRTLGVGSVAPPAAGPGEGETEARPAARERLLLALRRGDVDRSPLSALSLAAWTEVLDLADAHGVAPALHRVLQAEGLAVPPEVRTRLRDTTLSIGARNARTLGHLARILRDFRSAGIDVAVLKGADLVERVYDDVSLRPMADVDLLVRADDVKRATARLAAAGHVPAGGAADGEHQEAIDENLHVEPVQKPGGPLVELHYAIGVPARIGGIDMEGVWSRMEAGQVGRAEARVLSPEDLLLHLCIHVSLHHGFDAKLVQLVDLRAVADRLGDRIDWAVLSTRAREWGVHRAVALTFALAERLLGPVAPPGKAPQFAGTGAGPDEPPAGGDPVEQAERLLFQSGRRGVGSANLPVLLGEGSWLAKARLVARRVFPSRAEMAFTYRVPADSPRIYLLYPRRVVELLRRHGGTVRAVGKGDAAARKVLSMEQDRAELVEWMQRDGGS